MVFISYAHEDEEWKERLMSHLEVLVREGLIQTWDDRKIDAGEEWEVRIREAMEHASIAVLLVSEALLSSRYVTEVEVPALLARRAEEGLRIIPVIVRSCAWQSVSWLRQLQVRPTDGRPLAGGGSASVDADLAMLADEIHLLARSAGAQAQGMDLVPLPPERVFVSYLPIAGRHFFGRDEELAQLDGAWADPATRVLSIVAWGGAGKSVLVGRWLRRLEADHYRGAERVYGWSFFSQGLDRKKASSNAFLKDATQWYGGEFDTDADPRSQGRTLAELVRRSRSLLILDGIEPLLRDKESEPGRFELRDLGLKTLVRELAASGPGLCVITSRQVIAELEEFQGTSARRLLLEDLPKAAGVETLRAFGVGGDTSDLESAVVWLSGHALSIRLLGSTLTEAYGGKISRRGEIESLARSDSADDPASRIMITYKALLGEGPELDLLRLLGLFDRPATRGDLRQILEPPIPGLTTRLPEPGSPDWNRVVGKLRRLGLLTPLEESQPETLDTHPLIREHFGAELKTESPAVWRRAQRRFDTHLLTDDELKLVSYTINYVKRDEERILYGPSVKLVSDNMTSDAFTTWVVADWLSNPPENRTEIDRKFIRVSYEVIGRWPKQRLKFRENQLEALRGIEKAIKAQGRPTPEGVEWRPQERTGYEEKQLEVLRGIAEALGADRRPEPEGEQEHE